jgi:hypothetical protein
MQQNSKNTQSITIWQKGLSGVGCMLLGLILWNHLGSLGGSSFLRVSRAEAWEKHKVREAHEKDDKLYKTIILPTRMVRRFVERPYPLRNVRAKVRSESAEGETMSIDPKNFRELIVRPTLQEAALWSEEAEELLLLTAAHETLLGTYLRQGWKALNDGRGVGLGPYSMEPATYRWLQGLYPQSLGSRKAEDMVWDFKLATLAARLRYRVVPQELPSAQDVEGLAKYWDKWYNGNPKAGTWQEAALNYRTLVEGEK